MLVLEDLAAVQKEVRALRRAGKSIGFVPTMGYLHEGHISLIHLARRHTDHVFASIFVNPAQFNNPKDLESYPRDIPRDLAMLESANTYALFMPTPEWMYGPNFETWVNLDKLPLPHEGAHRPGHFRGVSTVVTMLFNVVQPDVAVFGEKDFQQLRIIERMVDDLKFPIQIVRGPLVRESDGLAMSSRNVRLSAEARSRALGISRGLSAALDAYKGGQRTAKELCAIVRHHLSQPGITIEYVELAEEKTLQPVERAGHEPTRMLVAAVVGGVRLIDNMALPPGLR
ncbi:MAG: pantoate--beta-alanine ligase [Oligoflexia bacterium]|nr:pantoate--beta-alanine ligase [Oligoflexia bacterium]